MQMRHQWNMFVLLAQNTSGPTILTHNDKKGIQTQYVTRNNTNLGFSYLLKPRNIINVSFELTSAGLSFRVDAIYFECTELSLFRCFLSFILWMLASFCCYVLHSDGQSQLPWVLTLFTLLKQRNHLNISLAD